MILGFLWKITLGVHQGNVTNPPVPFVSGVIDAEIVPLALMTSSTRCHPQAEGILPPYTDGLQCIPIARKAVIHEGSQAHPRIVYTASLMLISCPYANLMLI
jgi:hypothetical protein